MKSSQGLYREEFHEFQYEPINHEWAFEMETNIKDFIQLNESAGFVEISLLNCKSYRCELGLLISEPETKSGKRIFDQMTLEPWFKFIAHYNFKVLDDSFNVVGNYFFMKATP